MACGWKLEGERLPMVENASQSHETNHYAGTYGIILTFLDFETVVELLWECPPVTGCFIVDILDCVSRLRPSSTESIVETATVGPSSQFMSLDNTEGYRTKDTPQSSRYVASWT
jgi:hypothetical protein